MQTEEKRELSTTGLAKAKLSSKRPASVTSSSFSSASTKVEGEEALAFSSETVVSANTKLLEPGMIISDTQTPNIAVASHPASSSPTETLAELWEEAVSNYRRTVSLQPSEAYLLIEGPTALNITEQFETTASEWLLFRDTSKHVKFKAVRDRIGGIVRVLQDKVALMDVLIGFPSQAVHIPFALK
jgi:hypothetical protein